MAGCPWNRFNIDPLLHILYFGEYAHSSDNICLSEVTRVNEKSDSMARSCLNQDTSPCGLLFPSTKVVESKHHLRTMNI